MRLGLVARADNTGLGTQTWEFYRHMSPHKTMVVDISALNNNPQYFDRYPGAQIVHGFPNLGDIRAFLQDLDVVFVAESPYNYALYQMAKDMGVKVAVQYNYEFFDWYSYPHFPTPDLLIAPSMWHYEKVQAFADERHIKHVYLHCPVARDRIPFRPTKQFKHFIHIEGKVASHDRNGTETVWSAMPAVQADSGAELKVHTQSGELGLENYWDLYREGDVLVLPRRYGGNCLPVNEALSAGMPVIMTDISPNNSWLPHDWLVPATKTSEFKPRMVIDIYEARPTDLAAKIEEFANMTPEQVGAHQAIANALADKISWDTMKPKYKQALEALL